jgi:predicted MPP superfamily phosphohydrolase
METKTNFKKVTASKKVQGDSVRNSGEPRKKRILPVIAALLISMGLYSFIEPFWIDQKFYVINHPDIPASFDNTRIVFLADIHHGRFFSRSRIRKVVDLANKLNPQLILLGGDYVEGSPDYIEGCFEELGKLSAELGVYGVLGNHDHWQGADKTREAMIKQGILSIDNNAFWVHKDGHRIRVGGVGDHCEDVQNLEVTTGKTLESDFVLLVSHSPDYALDITGDKVDLLLSGHTHGGQVTLFGLYAPKVPSRYGQRFRTGEKVVNSIQVIISNGIGTVLLPIRFFARPQIVIIQLEAS